MSKTQSEKLQSYRLPCRGDSRIARKRRISAQKNLAFLRGVWYNEKNAFFNALEEDLCRGLFY